MRRKLLNTTCLVALSATSGFAGELDAGPSPDASNPQSSAALADNRIAYDLPPFTVTPVQMDSPDGSGIIRGWWAEVDLTWPGLEAVVTDPLVASASPEIEATLTPTHVWARQQGVALAINANYFRTLDAAIGSADVLGLSISDRQVVSPARAFEGVYDPVLIFSGHGQARILTPDAAFSAEEVEDAVAGIGASPTDPNHGGLLVEHGVNLGRTARVEPLERHPRTAVGVNQAGDRLMLVVIDGRLPGWSVGITLPELGQLMIDRGTYDAINLDGGGSSEFYFNPTAVPGSPAGALPPSPVLSRPSEGESRAVANHLGLRVNLDPAAPSNPARLTESE